MRPSRLANEATQSPWSAPTEFEQVLRQIGRDEGLDIRDRTQRLEALQILAQRFPHLTGQYGWRHDQPTPRSPSLGYRRQSPDQLVHDSIAAGRRRTK